MARHTSRVLFAAAMLQSLDAPTARPSEAFDLLDWLSFQITRWPTLLAAAAIGVALGAAAGWLSATNTKGEVLVQFGALSDRPVDTGRQVRERMLNRPFVEAALRADPKGRGEAWIDQLRRYDLDAEYIRDTNLVRLSIAGPDGDMVRHLCDTLSARLVAEEKIAYEQGRAKVEEALVRAASVLDQPLTPASKDPRDAAITELARNTVGAQQAHLLPTYIDTIARLHTSSVWSEPKVLDGTYIEVPHPERRAARGAFAGLAVGLALAATSRRRRSATRG